VSNVIIVHRVVLQVSHKQAKNLLQLVIRRGYRLSKRDPSSERMHLWYSACQGVIQKIYPTHHPADSLLKSFDQNVSNSERILSVIDNLEDLRETVSSFSEPPVGVTLLQWILRRPLTANLLTLTTGAAAWEGMRRLLSFLFRGGS